MKGGLIIRRGVGVNKARLGQPRGRIIALEISPTLFARCDCGVLRSAAGTRTPGRSVTIAAIDIRTRGRPGTLVFLRYCPGTGTGRLCVPKLPIGQLGSAARLRNGDYIRPLVKRNRHAALRRERRGERERERERERLPRGNAPLFRRQMMVRGCRALSSGSVDKSRTSDRHRSELRPFPARETSKQTSVRARVESIHSARA